MKCPDCNGTGQAGTNCCGDKMIGETDLCAHCKEHAEMDPCENCRGSGEVEPPSDTEKWYARLDHRRELEMGK